MKIKEALLIAIDELDNAYCNEKEHPEPRKDRVKELSQAIGYVALLVEVLKEHGSSFLHELDEPITNRGRLIWEMTGEIEETDS